MLTHSPIFKCLLYGSNYTNNICLFIPSTKGYSPSGNPAKENRADRREETGHLRQEEEEVLLSYPDTSLCDSNTSPSSISPMLTLIHFVNDDIHNRYIYYST